MNESLLFVDFGAEGPGGPRGSIFGGESERYDEEEACDRERTELPEEPGMIIACRALCWRRSSGETGVPDRGGGGGMYSDAAISDGGGLGAIGGTSCTTVFS